MDWSATIAHWCEAVGVLIALGKIILLLGRNLQKFDHVVTAVQTHSEKIEDHEDRIIAIEYSTPPTGKPVKVRH